MMRALNLIFLGAWIVLSLVFVGRVISQLVSGRLAGPGGKAAASRSDNTALYWRRMAVEMVMAAAMVSLLMMSLGRLVH